MTVFVPVLKTPTTAYSVQPGCGFTDPLYYAARKAVHNAIDLNAVTGGNTDLGDPVHAADGGTVVAATWDSYIGGIVEILHPDGDVSGYWHLRDVHVKQGQFVNGGDLIGQIGQGARRDMSAHLHFYIKHPGADLPPAFWPSSHYKDRATCEGFVRAHYYEPLAWLAARGAKKTLADLQAQRGDPVKVEIVRGDATENVMGKLVPMPERGMTLDARTASVRLYLNEKFPGNIPALPPSR